MKCATDCVQVHTPHIHGLTDRTGPRATDNQELVADQVAIRTVLSVLLSFLLQQFAEKRKAKEKQTTFVVLCDLLHADIGIALIHHQARII